MRRSAVLAFAIAALTGAAAAEPADYADPARRFSMKVPDGWSAPAPQADGSAVTMSGDGGVRCTVSAIDMPQTATKTQDQINLSMQAYTADVWKQRFFAGGVTGTLENSGITRMEQYDAPWARGLMVYPNGATAKFGALMIAGPGRLATITCNADPAVYDANLGGVTTVLNWLRPL